MLQYLLTISDEYNHEKIKHIYYTYHKKMIKYAIIKLRTYNRPNAMYDAEDVVQDTFVKIVKYINNIDFSRDERDVKNYIFTMLNNEILIFLRYNDENIESFEEFIYENEYDYIEELDAQENYNKIVKAIEDLDEKYSSSLYMFFCEKMSVQEIAKIMGISPKTIYTRIARGKKLLFDSLKGVN